MFRKYSRLAGVILIASLILVLGVISIASVYAASPIYVRTDGDDTACDGTVDADASFAPACAVKTIQKGIDLADPSGVVNVAAGTYAEDITVNKSLDIRGPNYGISPNTGVRVAEAVVVPATAAIATGEIFHVEASDVSIDGFTIDGDNTALASGYTSTNAADIDAAEGVTVYVDNVNNLTVSNNIIQNLSYFGVTIFGATYSAPATTGHLVDDNLFQDMGTYDVGSGIAKWGGGVLLYNGQYAAVTNNVMENVRIGVQTGNFHAPNPGVATYQVIDNNTIQVRRLGIFHNLQTGSPSPYTLSNNSITGLADVNETGAKGILLASLSTASTSQNNTINLSGVLASTYGYEVWNVDSTTPAAISGGSVSGVDIGLFLNNYEGYSSDAASGAHASVSGLSITPNAGGTGIRVLDSPSSTTHANVQLAIGAGVTVNGGTKGMTVENASASVTSTSDLALSGQTGNYIELVNNAVDIDATGVSFDGQTGATATLAQNFAIEDKVVHKVDNSSLGLVRVKAGEIFVTTSSGSIQRGINAATAGDTVNVDAGTYAEYLTVNKSVILDGAGNDSNPLTNTVISPVGGTGIAVGADNVTLKSLRIDPQGSGRGISVIASINDLSIDHVTATNADVGLRVGSGIIVNGLTVVDSHFDGNLSQGWYLSEETASGGMVTNVHVTDTTFNDNVNKGIYAEKLDHAVFDGITVNNSGTGGALNHRAGIDINLKWGAYSDIQILNSTISNNGTGDPNGGGLLIKARSTGSYASPPATLSNVTLTNLTVIGNGGGTYAAGIRIGESNNSFTGIDAGPTGVVISNSAFSGNMAHAVRNATAATTILAENNFWGACDGPGPVGPGSGDNVSIDVDYDPFVSVAPAGILQALIDAAAPGATIDLGTCAPYQGVTVDKPLTINLNGSTIGEGSPAFTINADDVTINGPGTLDGWDGAANSTFPGVLVNAGSDNFILNGVEVKRWADGIELAGSVDSFKLANNWIHNNTDAGLQVDGGVILGGIVTIEGNLFKANGGNGVQNDSGLDVDATYNSWGADGGPGVSGANDVSTDVTYDPWTFSEVYIDVDPITGLDQYTRNVDESTSFDIDLNVDGENLYGIAFEFTYDPAFLTFNGPPDFDPFWDGSCVVDAVPVTDGDGTNGTFRYVCNLLGGSAWNGGTVATFNFTAIDNGGYTPPPGPWTTYFDISADEADTSSGAVGGVKVFVNNAGYGDASVPDRDIVDSDDGEIIITGIANYTGYIDLQGRSNDSGATLLVKDQQLIAGFTDLAQGTSASSGKYTTAYINPNLLTIGDEYWFQVDASLYLPTTVKNPLATNWADSKVLSTRPLTTLDKVILLGGDGTDDDVVGLLDATCIGSAYGTTNNNCVGGPGANSDVNGDGIVNILDLVLMGGNFDLDASPWTP